MLDDFFARAIIAGCLIAIVCGPFGCFIIWRRLSYFGDTLAHSALLGVAMGIWADLNLTLAVFLVCAVIALILFGLQRVGGLPSDALLGILSHSSLALGLVALALMPWVRMDLSGLLFGDILAVTKLDLLVIASVGGVLLIALVFLWRQLFASTVSPDIAAAERMHTDLVQCVFMVMLALLISIAMKITGVLLITALLIIPAATARRFSESPEAMAILASAIGAVAVVCGLEASLVWDIPSGPAIVVTTGALFSASLIRLGLRRRRTRQRG